MKQVQSGAVNSIKLRAGIRMFINVKNAQGTNQVYYKPNHLFDEVLSFYLHSYAPVERGDRRLIY